MKSVGVAYLLWLFGFHRFYLGRPGTAIIYICTCGGCGIWSLIDLFLIPIIVTEENAMFASLFKGNQSISVNVDSSSGKRSRRRRDEDDD